MGDVKLFRMSGDGAAEIGGATAVIERRLQVLFEQNLESLLGVRFLASEFSTGGIHGGRIDTLGIDEDGSPVIIEYKRTTNENVINQGLYYLDWLLDHRGDFSMLVQKALGPDAVGSIDWSGPRLLCIAGDFTRYDEHAVRLMPRNIELMRYRSFGEDLLMIDLVHNPRLVRASKVATNMAKPPAEDSSAVPAAAAEEQYRSQQIAYRMSQTKGELKDTFDATYEALEAMGTDVQVKEQKYYIAFKRIKNFACLEVYPQTRTVVVHLKIDPNGVTLEDGFTRDMRKTGHFGTGDLQVSIRDLNDIRRAQPLFALSYENS